MVKPIALAQSNAVAPFVPPFPPTFSAPAWLNYMTNFNKVYGNFADPRSEMFMTLNRRYEHYYDDAAKRFEILDQTTYIAYRDWETDRKSTRLNSSHITRSRMPSSA